MDGRLMMNRTSFISHDQQEDSENSPENSGDSPRSSMLNNDGKMACTSSPKKSSSTKRSIQKRVVSVPIKDIEGSRLKGEMGAPPSDSWAWRKYGQKPIKGSPYPRGYYRCSSSKGCPARKQVERSRLDPKMVVVTYSCEHNHPWPAPRNQNQHNQISNNSFKTAKITTRDASTTSTNSEREEEEEEEEEDQGEKKPKKFASQATLNNSDEKFVSIGEGSPIASANNDHGWFSEFECTTSSTMLESPILTENRIVTDTDTDMAMAFTMRNDNNDDDESFFADLGELPECSAVFRRGMMERDEERRRLSLTPWCGTTG